MAASPSLEPLIGRLHALYPNAHCELDFHTPLQLLIATILSAQCTDVLVNKVTPALFAKYRRAADYAAAPLPELEEAIHRIGLFRNKAKNIKLCCQTLADRFGGEVPRTLEELIDLAGVGRKTANVVLGNAFGIESGVVVDTHVTRLCFRLGITRKTDPAKIEQVLIKRVPRAQWTLFSHLLIWHGRRRCMARNPDCLHCEVAELCPKRGVSPEIRRLALEKEG